MLATLEAKLIAAGLAVALLGSLWGVWTWRGHELARARSQVAAKDREIAGLQVVAAHVAKVQAVTDKSEEASVKAQVQIRTVTQTIIQKVPYAITPETDAHCTVPTGLVRLFNAAATGADPDAVPAPAGLADGDPSGIECSELASAIVGNFGIARATTRQLADLQDWAKAQEAANP